MVEGQDKVDQGAPTVTPTVMAKTSCSQPGVFRGSKVTCRKEDTMKPATMPDRKEKPRSCSLRSSCSDTRNVGQLY